MPCVVRLAAAALVLWICWPNPFTTALGYQFTVPALGLWWKAAPTLALFLLCAAASICRWAPRPAEGVGAPRR